MNHTEKLESSRRHLLEQMSLMNFRNRQNWGQLHIYASAIGRVLKVLPRPELNRGKLNRSRTRLQNRRRKTSKRLITRLWMMMRFDCKQVCEDILTQANGSRPRNPFKPPQQVVSDVPETPISNYMVTPEM